MNGNFYVEVLRRLRASVVRAQPDFAQGGRWILHHDNAPAHTSLVVREFLARRSITVTPALFTRFSPLATSPVPKMQNDASGVALGGCGSQQGGNDTATEDFQQSYQQWNRR